MASTFDLPGYSTAEFGVPLSAAEVALIEERQARTAMAMAGHEWAHRQPGFAGSWTDQSRDGLIVYQFSTGADIARLELDRLLPPAVRYEVREVERGLEELRRLKEAIATGVPELEAAGIEVISIGLAVSDNTVRVGVAEGLDQARRIIGATYGDSIEVAAEDRGAADTGADPIDQEPPAAAQSGG